MSDYAISLKRTGLLLAALTFTALLMVVNFASFFGQASAAQLTSRSLTLSSTLAGTETTGAAGTETNGSAANYSFTFTPSTSVIGAVIFKACTTALGTCVDPVMGGGDANPMFDAATLSSDNLAQDTQDWILDNSGLEVVDAECDGTDGLKNCIAVTTTDPHAQAGTPVTVTFTGVENPLVTEAFYVRIQTYAATAFTTPVDDGTVASAITEGIEITARVAETLGFSTTGDFGGVGDPGDSCAALTGSGAITLGDPANENTLSLTSAYDNYSAFRLYTNAAGGVTVQYEGDTLRHSNLTDDIDPMAAVADADYGVEQFGLAVDDVVGGSADVDSASRDNMVMSWVDDAAGFAADGVLDIVADYENGDGVIAEGSGPTFKFVTNPVATSRVPDTIANTTGYTECKTVPVRYMANISPTTTSGTYTTTIVYSAVPIY